MKIMLAHGVKMIFYLTRREAELPTDDFADLMGSGHSKEIAGSDKAKKSFLPSQLFDLSSLSLESSSKHHPQIQQQSSTSAAGDAVSRHKGVQKI